MPRKKVDNARATLRRPKRTDKTKIQVTRSTAQQMEDTSLYAQSPELKAAGKRWKDAADRLEMNGAKIADLKSLLLSAQNQQRIERRAWEVATQHILAVATTAAQGLMDNVRILGFDVQTRGKSFVEAPDEITSKKGTDSGEVTFRWTCPSARNGYVVQSASDPSDPRTFSQLAVSTRTKFTIKGLAPRAVIHFRVAAVDPASDSGQGPWSMWNAGTAR